MGWSDFSQKHYAKNNEQLNEFIIIISSLLTILGDGVYDDVMPFCKPSNKINMECNIYVCAMNRNRETLNIVLLLKNRGGAPPKQTKPILYHITCMYMFTRQCQPNETQWE